MTKQILFSAFILLALIGRAQDCTLPGNLQQGLVGYWPFCGNANDESGNGNDGVVYGALLSEDRFGNADQSYYFNGNLSNRIVVELTDSIPAFANKTISTWIKLPEQYIHSYSSIVVCDNTVPNFGGTYLSTNGIEPSYVTAGTVGHFYEGKAGLMSNFPLNDNQWHHVVLINNFDSLRSELFIDGVLHTVLSSNNYLGDGAISNVYFGNVDSYWLTDAAIFGNLDDIGIWNRALTPAEIASLYTGEPVVQPVCAELDPALQNGLVGYWPFCGNANDESGNGNDGVVNGATLTEDRFGNAGSAYDFNGTNQFISINSNATFDLPNEVTLSAWFVDSSHTTGRLLSRLNEGSDPAIGWTLSVDNQSNNGNPTHFKIRFTIGGAQHYSGLLSYSNGWRHIVAVYNLEEVRVYLDNALIFNTNQESSTPSFSNNLIIGSNSYAEAGAFNPETFNGALDDIGIWNRALTPAEITSLYTGEPVVQPVCAELDPALQTGLVGYWPFCGGATDESGNGNNGVVNGATLTEDRNGNANSAYSFNGINNDITIPNTLDALISNEMTVSMWFNMDDNVDHQSLFLRQGSDFTKTWILAMDGTNEIRCYNENGAYSNVTAPTSLYNAWQQLTAVFTDSVISTYINGVLIAEENVGFPLSWSSEPIILGGTEGTGNNPYPYLGSLDDVGIWNRALTPAEITSLYTGEPVVQPGCAELDPALQNGLVGYWPFCGNANDESGNGNDGVVNGATLTEDRFGNVGSAYDFNGLNSAIEVQDAPNLSLLEDFSISCWIQYDSLNLNPGQISAFVNKHAVGNDQSGYIYGMWQSSNGYDGLLNFSAPPHFDNLTYASEPEGILLPDQWYLTSVTYDDNSDLLSYYLNGTLIDTISISLDLDENDYNLIFGASVYFGGTVPDWDYFNGTLDDIGIWNRALTAEEVALLYGNFTQPVAGCTDPTAFNYNPQATVNEGCEYIATIFVFNDLNGNGIHEANEPGLTNWPVLGNDISGLVWTNGNGNAFLPLESGSYEFTVLNTTDNWVSTTPTSVTIDLTSGPATASFGLQVIPGEAIVAAGPFTGFWDILHCTDGYESGVYLENIGSQAVSGFMTLTCDPLFTPDADSYFTTPPVEVGPGYALWNVEDFLPGEYELLSFHIDGPGVEYLNQSFTFAFDLTLFDPQGNMIYSENWSVSPIVACAYDPNDITGFPEGLSAPHEEGYTIEHFILPDNMVEFRVRFQNTGTLPAEDIDIYIPIDHNHWELSTIFPLMRSAEMQVICLHDDGTLDFSTLEHPLPDGVTATDLLIFSFDDIYLPDSASNPEGSQGYVYFRMRAKHTLNIGDEINAQAFIYFEQNPPIATNETYHVIFDCESFTPMAGDAEICDGESLIFDATQPYVDAYEWQLNNVVIGSANMLQYPAEVGTYTLELNTKNVLCPQGENHDVTVIVHEIPELDLPLDASVCEGEELNYEAESNGSVTWSNGANTGDLFTADQSFTATATAIGEGNCSTSEDWSVTVNPLPSAAVDSANFVLTAVDGVAWQWLINGVEDVTTQSITATENANYQVEITNEFGCAAFSDVIEVELPNPNNLFVHLWTTLHLYPNPMTAGARLELPQGIFDITLYDITGACVRTLSNQQGTVAIERASLASGVYQLQVRQGEAVKSVRLVVE